MASPASIALGDLLGEVSRRFALPGRAPFGAPAGGVDPDARPHLEDRPHQLGRRLGSLLDEVEEHLEARRGAPILNPGRASLRDPDEARLLQSLERFADGMTVDAEVLGEHPLRRNGITGRERAAEDLLAQALVDGGRSKATGPRVRGFAHPRFLHRAGDPVDTARPSRYEYARHG